MGVQPPKREIMVSAAINHLGLRNVRARVVYRNALHGTNSGDVARKMNQGTHREHVFIPPLPRVEDLIPVAEQHKPPLLSSPEQGPRPEEEKARLVEVRYEDTGQASITRHSCGHDPKDLSTSSIVSRY